MKKAEKQMRDRLLKSLDPLTGDKIQTTGKIIFNGICCIDETGKQVILNNNGTWVYSC